MKRKLVMQGSLMFLLSATLLWAGDPWKEKPYTEWTQKDVQKVFQDSPWAHTVRILSGDVNLGRGPGPPSPPSAPGGGPAPPLGGQQPAEPGGAWGQGTPQRTVFVVLWGSSLTARQALVRQLELQGSIDPEQKQGLLSAELQQYQIVIYGPDMRAFQGLTEEAVRESAYLKPKRSKQKISPQRVEFLRQGTRLTEVHLFFPRQVDGEAVIGPEEKKVEVFCRASTADISTEFNLRKMTREGARDL